MEISLEELEKLNNLSVKLRLDILNLLEKGGSGHIGGSFSSLDILIALYYKILNNGKFDSDSPTRDRFILSKGHAELAMYSVLLELGHINSSENDIMKAYGSVFQGHPNKEWIKGVEFSTGSLGQGISFAVGQAICGKKDGFNVYTLLGDGELQEGQVWEAIITIPRFALSNLTIIIDYNKFQLEGEELTINNKEDLKKVFEGWGYYVKIIDGHNYKSIVEALSLQTDAAKIIIADTIKGKGISFMENNNEYHGKQLTEEEIKSAKQELKYKEG